jgi:hypothetical protein
MPQFGPELSWTRSRPAVLALVVAALLMLAALAPSARAQEVPVAPPADPGAPPAEQPADTGAPVEPPPVATDPAPQPEPVPVPEPSPPPEQPADPQPTPTFDEQPVADRPGEGSSGSRDSASHSTSPSFSPQPVATSVSAPSAPVALAPPETQLTAAPLGWDLYDDALFAESVDGDESAAALAGGGPPSFGGLGVLGAMSRSIAHEKHRDAAAGSRPNATPAGGSGPGGGGPGPGQSMGLAGGGGGASAGIALLMLLGLACGWSLLAPRDRRAFRTSTATWRPSAYVPPIEHPG